MYVALAFIIPLISRIDWAYYSFITPLIGRDYWPHYSLRSSVQEKSFDKINDCFFNQQCLRSWAAWKMYIVNITIGIADSDAFVDTGPSVLLFTCHLSRATAAQVLEEKGAALSCMLLGTLGMGNFQARISGGCWSVNPGMCDSKSCLLLMNHSYTSTHFPLDRRTLSL